MIKRVSTRNSILGYTLIEVAFILPIAIGVFLIVAQGAIYLRAAAVVNDAATIAADIASGAKVDSTNYPMVAHLTRPNPPYLSIMKNNRAHCRATTAAEALGCTGGGGLVSHLSLATPAGWAMSHPAIQGAYPTPFSLNNTDLNRGWAMHLPLASTWRTCRDSFTEQDATLGGSCQDVRPMFWQMPELQDFDGDGKEDYAHFLPTGTSETWGFGNVGEGDFLVRSSGQGYGMGGGLSYINLAVDYGAASLNAMPITADYDRDGRADPAIFDPLTGDYRIAMSSSNYRDIVGDTLPLGSSDFGYIAIAGKFYSVNGISIAVIQTAGPSATRYEMTITDPIVYSVGVAFTPPALNSVSDERYKPIPGMAAVPAFADYDDNGIVEVGWLQYSTGDLVTHNAGWVETPQTAVPPPLETRVEGEVSEPKDTRMHPYDIEIGSADGSDYLYYLDRVDGRVWQMLIDPDGTLRNAQVIVNSVTAVRSPAVIAGMFPGFGSVAYPESNFNIPQYDEFYDDCDIFCPVGTGASEYALQNPTDIHLTPQHELLIADAGNRRVLRVYNGGSALSSSSAVQVILGSNACRNYGDCDEIGPNEELTLTGPDATYGIDPLAVGTVPNDENPAANNLVVSTGFGVILLEPGNDIGAGSPQRIPHGRGDLQWIVNINNDPPNTSATPSATDTAVVFEGLDGRDRRICPVIDIEEDRGDLLLASSCSAYVAFGGGFSSGGSATGGILRVINEGEDFKSVILEVEAGSFRLAPCKVGGGARHQCSIPRNVGGGNTGLHQRKVSISGAHVVASPDKETAPFGDIDIINPLSLEVDASGNIYFVNQWDMAKRADSATLTNNPQFYGNTHLHSVYRINVERNRIEPIGNPYSYGNGTVPVEGAWWHSPYINGDGYQRWIKAHTTPASLALLPAGYGVALNSAGTHLFTSTPWRNNPPEYNCDSVNAHPYCTPLERVGFIHSVALDRDGDTILDPFDADIDGDGILNAADPSDYCPQVFSNAYCRVADIARIPRVTASPLFGQMTVGGISTVDYTEFFVMNSVSEFDSQNQTQARQEALATLFDYGRSTGLTAGDIGFGNRNSPYWFLDNRNHGPIAMPNALHGLVGLDANSMMGRGYANNNNIQTGMSDERLFKFPFITHSHSPRENGFKPVRRIVTPGAYYNTPSTYKSGVLCWDYEHEQSGGAGAATKLGAAARPFALNLDDYLGSYFWSGVDSTEEETQDSDNLNYVMGCSVPGAQTFTNGMTYKSEGLVYQLHNNEEHKGNAGGLQWPSSIFTGRPFTSGQLGDPAPEGTRRFHLIDADGNGVRDPTWFSSERGQTIQNLQYRISTTIGLRDGSILPAYRIRYPTSSEYIAIGWLAPPTGFNLFYPLFFMAGNSLGHEYPTEYKLFDGAKDNVFEEALLTSPHYDAWVTTTPKDLATVLQPDLGAKIYHNWTRENRWSPAGGVPPPPLQAARNVLGLGLSVDPVDDLGTPASLQPGEYYVRYLDDAFANCNFDCTKVEVGYGISVFGVNTTIRRISSLVLGENRQRCNPDYLGFTTSPCTVPLPPPIP